MTKRIHPLKLLILGVATVGLAGCFSANRPEQFTVNAAWVHPDPAAGDGPLAPETCNLMQTAAKACWLFKDNIGVYALTIADDPNDAGRYIAKQGYTDVYISWAQLKAGVIIGAMKVQAQAQS